MSFREVEKEAEKQVSPGDFAAALFDSAVQERWNGIAQLTGAKKMNVVSAKNDTMARKAGHVAGMALDMFVLSRIVGAPVGRAIARAGIYGTIPGAALELGTVGAVYGGLLTPSDCREGLAAGRMKNAAIDFVTFGAMGGAATGLKGLKWFSPANLAGTLKLSALSGAIGGLANTETAALVNGHLAARPADYVANAASFAAFSTLFGAANFGAEKLSYTYRTRFPGDATNTEVLGRPGPGISREMIKSGKELSAETGEPIIFFGSRQTGISEKTAGEGSPRFFTRKSDLDLAVTSKDMLFNNDVAWKRIPKVKHQPMGLFSIEQALSMGYLVIRPIVHGISPQANFCVSQEGKNT